METTTEKTRREEIRKVCRKAVGLNYRIEVRDDAVFIVKDIEVEKTEIILIADFRLNNKTGKYSLTFYKGGRNSYSLNPSQIQTIERKLAVIKEDIEKSGLLAKLNKKFCY